MTTSTPSSTPRSPASHLRRFACVLIALLLAAIAATPDVAAVHRPPHARLKPGGGNCTYEYMGCRALCAFGGSCLYDHSVCDCYADCDQRYDLCFQDPNLGNFSTPTDEAARQ